MRNVVRFYTFHLYRCIYVRFKIKGELYQTSALKQFPLSFLSGPILFPYTFEFISKLDDSSHITMTRLKVNKKPAIIIPIHLNGTMPTEACNLKSLHLWVVMAQAASENIQKCHAFKIPKTPTGKMATIIAVSWGEKKIPSSTFFS